MALVAVLASSCGSSSTRSASPLSSTGADRPSGQPANGSPGPERIRLENGAAIAPAQTTVPGTTVDGIHCAPVEQLAYHIHVHLQVYVDGQPRSLPGGIGMVGAVPEQTPAGPFYGAVRCYYWLHTHTYDGVIHIESPSPRIYDLGTFFDVWGQPLSSDQVAGAKGKVSAFINGRPWTKSPRSVPLVSHAVIQLDVGSPTVPFGATSWGGTNL